MKITRSTAIPYEPASHEDPRRPGCLKRILLRKDELKAGTFQMLNWAKIEPGKGFTPHYHEDMQEVFVIVSGSAEMMVGTDTAALSPGDCVLVPAGTIHKMRNTGGTDLEYIVFGISTGQGGKTVLASGHQIESKPAS